MNKKQKPHNIFYTLTLKCLKQSLSRWVLKFIVVARQKARGTHAREKRLSAILHFVIYICFFVPTYLY